jgi:hypothetical protein
MNKKVENKNKDVTISEPDVNSNNQSNEGSQPPAPNSVKSALRKIRGAQAQNKSKDKPKREFGTRNSKSKFHSETRKKRIPLHKQRFEGLKNKDPDYFYYKFNDVEDNIERALTAGYEFVDRDGAAVKGIDIHDRTQDHADIGKLASSSVGGGITGYYMRIPLKWREEDQADMLKDRIAERAEMNQKVEGVEPQYTLKPREA